jgi:NADH-quinone oxidoreductase subunit M
LQQAFFGKPEASAVDGDGAVSPAAAPLEPISVPERLGAVLLIAISLLVGLYPRVLMDLIWQSFGPPLFERLPGGIP